MPCNTYQGNDIDLHRKYETHGEQLANMLCRTIKLFDDNLGYENLPEDIQKWYQEHKKWDDGRK